MRELIHPPGIWTIEVGWTSVRPIIPDQHCVVVRVVADDDADAMLNAAMLVSVLGAGRGPACVMVTRTRIIEVEF